MVNQVYLALYKGNRSGKGFTVWKSRLGDWLTRKLTKGQYSHCEIAIKQQVWESGHHYDHETVYMCYSSSIRDGGVRKKIIDVDSDKWDLIPLKGITKTQIVSYFSDTEGKQYDLWGAIGLIFGTRENANKFFCSEWCANAISGGTEGWRFSPNHLAAIFRNKTRGIE